MILAGSRKPKTELNQVQLDVDGVRQGTVAVPGYLSRRDKGYLADIRQPHAVHDTFKPQEQSGSSYMHGAIILTTLRGTSVSRTSSLPSSSYRYPSGCTRSTIPAAPQPRAPFPAAKCLSAQSAAYPAYRLLAQFREDTYCSELNQGFLSP
jgi:hypothetical protein